MSTAREDLEVASQMSAREAQAVANAFHRTFETKDGKRVLDYLERISNYHGKVFMPVKTGSEVFAYDPITAALTDGGRQIVIEIHRQLSIPCEGDANAKPKTKIRK